MISRWIARKSIDPEVRLSPRELRECINEAYEELHRDEGGALGLVIMFPLIFVFGVGTVLWSVKGHPLWMFWTLGALLLVTFVICAILIPAPFIRRPSVFP